jgi:hypothetical protein
VLSWYVKGYSNSEYDRECIINIAGGINNAEVNQENNASEDSDNIEQSNSSTVSQSIDITNNIVISISTNNPGVYTIKEAGKDINIEVSEDGAVKLNGETMDIKELPNGVKVMYIQDKQTEEKKIEKSS